MNIRYTVIGLLLVVFAQSIYANTMDEPFFVIVVPSYNNVKYRFHGEQLYRINLRSIFAQTYPYYRVIYVDDCSPDCTGVFVEHFVQQCGQEHRVTVIRNSERIGASANRYYAIHSCTDREIIVMMDGDDWFAHENVLVELAQVYKDPNVWMTYGQYRLACQACYGFLPHQKVRSPEECPHKTHQCAPLPPAEVLEANKIREFICVYRTNKELTGNSWVFGPTRTFYAGLFKKITDLQDKDGKFYGLACDIGETIPMVEMAKGHIKFMPKVSYIYNVDGRAAVTESENNANTPSVYTFFGKKKYQPLSTLGF